VASGTRAADRKSMLQHLIDFHSAFILKPSGCRWPQSQLFNDLA